MRKITEGYMPYLNHKTYYRIVDGGEKTPIVLIHGGPGSTHNYMELLDSIADTGRKVISYDQIGCGNSYLDGHPELWTADTWINELISLREYLGLKEVVLLGQSWGGMLIIQYMIDRKPEGVKGIVLSSTLPSASLWAHEQHRLISFMSKEDQEAIHFAEKNNVWDRPEYIHANEVFMKLHCSDIKDTDPECLTRKKKSGSESYLYGWGPNEYNPTGSLKDFEYIDELYQITIPTLIMSGTNDLCTPLIAKTMFDNIPMAQWELFDGARHMCFAEDNDHYCEVLSRFVRQID
jgi:proline iminopeptidase